MVLNFGLLSSIASLTGTGAYGKKERMISDSVYETLWRIFSRIQVTTVRMKACFCERHRWRRNSAQRVTKNSRYHFCEEKKTVVVLDAPSTSATKLCTLNTPRKPIVPTLAGFLPSTSRAVSLTYADSDRQSV